MATILVVDDEPPIRALVGRMLERKGHTVVLCEDGASALAVSEPVDLLLVDYVLPDTTGTDLITALRATRPGLPVILMSGYAQDSSMAPAPPADFLQKPMTPSALTELVARLLGPQ